MSTGRRRRPVGVARPRSCAPTVAPAPLRRRSRRSFVPGWPTRARRPDRGGPDASGDRGSEERKEAALRRSGRRGAARGSAGPLGRDDEGDRGEASATRGAPICDALTDRRAECARVEPGRGGAPGLPSGPARRAAGLGRASRRAHGSRVRRRGARREGLTGRARTSQGRRPEGRARFWGPEPVLFPGTSIGPRPAPPLDRPSPDNLNLLFGSVVHLRTLSHFRDSLGMEVTLQSSPEVGRSAGQ